MICKLWSEQEGSNARRNHQKLVQSMVTSTDALHHDNPPFEPQSGCNLPSISPALSRRSLLRVLRQQEHSGFYCNCRGIGGRSNLTQPVHASCGASGDNDTHYVTTIHLSTMDQTKAPTSFTFFRGVDCGLIACFWKHWCHFSAKRFGDIVS